MLVVGCYGLWCFGFSMQISLFEEVICYILIRLGVSIDIDRIYNFCNFFLSLYM